MGALPAEVARCVVSSERTGMEGKAKAERDSLTQAEEEDTSVQAYCADSCRQCMWLTRLSCIGQLVLAKIINGGARLAELISKSSAIGAELAQTKTSLMH